MSACLSTSWHPTPDGWTSGPMAVRVNTTATLDLVPVVIEDPCEVSVSMGWRVLNGEGFDLLAYLNIDDHAGTASRCRPGAYGAYLWRGHRLTLRPSFEVSPSAAGLCLDQVTIHISGGSKDRVALRPLWRPPAPDDWQVARRDSMLLLDRLRRMGG